MELVPVIFSFAILVFLLFLNIILLKCFYQLCTLTILTKMSLKQKKQEVEQVKGKPEQAKQKGKRKESPPPCDPAAPSAPPLTPPSSPPAVDVVLDPAFLEQPASLKPTPEDVKGGDPPVQDKRTKHVDECKHCEYGHPPGTSYRKARRERKDAGKNIPKHTFANGETVEVHYQEKTPAVKATAEVRQKYRHDTNFKNPHDAVKIWGQCVKEYNQSKKEKNEQVSFPIMVGSSDYDAIYKTYLERIKDLPRKTKEELLEPSVAPQDDDF